jgi:hypothetical protein
MPVRSSGITDGVGSGTTSTDPLTDPLGAETLTWLDPKKLSFHWDGGPGPIRLTVEADRSVLRVHASQAFPLSHPDRLVQLFTDGRIGIVENVGAMTAEDRRALQECLRRDRILPEVKRIISLEERRHVVLWVVETDRGVTSFDMDKVYENVRRQPAGDVVLTDVVRNRYHVDPEALDEASREMLGRYS